MKMDGHEMAWRLRAKQPSFQKLVESSKKIIDKAMQRARFVVSWSAGKDSTAMAHMVRSVCPDAPIMIQVDDCDWPEKAPYMDRVCLQQGWRPHIVAPDFSVWEMMQRYRIGEDDICAQSHAVTRLAFLEPLNRIRRELGCDGVYLGFRMSESIARKRNLTRRGPLYPMKDGTWRCAPLWRWQASDVFAYLVSNGIEINPCYFYNRFLQPEDIRLSWAIPTPAGLARGAMEHLRYYYPEQFRRLREKENAA